LLFKWKIKIMLLFSFQTEEQERIKHIFRHYYFHRPRVCFLCKQRVFSQGSACQGSSYFSYYICILIFLQSFPLLLMSEWMIEWLLFNANI
jgi:hypothetical protein